MQYDTIFIMDIIIVVFSLYILFTSVKMKKTGVVDKMILPEEEIKKLKDKKGFIEFMFPKMVAFAGVALACGVVGIISDKVINIPYWNYIEMVLMLGIVAFLSHQIRSAKGKY